MRAQDDADDKLSALLHRLRNLEAAWQVFMDKPSTSKSDLCLKPHGTRPGKLDMRLDIKASNVLFLVYLPAESVHSGNALSNKTQNQIIKPIIGEDTFVIQLLHAAYHDNDDVDPQLVKCVCRDPKSFVVTNYIERVKTVLGIRHFLKADSVGWLGGADVTAALGPLLQLR